MLTRLTHPFARPVAVALLFGLAFSASLFFNGVRIEFFAIAMSLLLLLLLSALWRGYDLGLKIPKTPLAITLSLFWAWLAITQLWSPVPYVSMVNFWWVGSAVFVFWLTTLVPEKNQSFPGVYAAVMAIGVLLALLGIYQQLQLGVQAQSTFLTRNSHAALMCLIAVPASSHFLLERGSSRYAQWASRLLGPLLFVLYFSIALTSSRGATLGLFMGLAVIVWLSYRHVSRMRLVVFTAIVLLAYLAANFLAQGEVATRLGTLVSLTKADPGRFLIWERSWRMLMDAPWFGIGLGTYWLHWPPYRHPQDGSAGFYVHNDYLQIWIETGLPGLLFLLAVYIAVLVTFIRLLRHAGSDTKVVIEAAGLFGGMLAIAVHTFFDFDFYIHPIQLALGLTLVRLHGLYLAHVPHTEIVVVPAHRMGQHGYRTIVSLAVLLPLLYFAALGYSAVLTYQSRELAATGRWADASMALSRAAQLMPTSDLVLMSHADLLRQAMTQLPPGSTERATLFKEAILLLEDAEQVNPLRPQIFFVRGLIYQQFPDLAGPHWSERAARAYAAALKRDPLAFWAREAYGSLLLSQGRRQFAKEILEAGADYQYFGKVALRYYLLLARLRRENGETAQARALEQKINEMTGGSTRLPERPALK